MQSWHPIPADSDFSIHNLPYGIFDPSDGLGARLGVAVGDDILCLRTAQKIGLFRGMRFDKTVFEKDKLNAFIALGKTVTSRIRQRIQKALVEPDSLLFQNKNVIFFNQKKSTLLLPIDIGDYTDFYSSEEHATNVGIMFRDPKNALLPNWKHLPVGYHGRSSSIVLSGTEIRRPSGQIVPKGEELPIFSPSRQLDFELEMGFVIGKSTENGQPISTRDAENHIFGLCLFNDWSARDIQKWEYVPLGPFLGKNFGSTMSPWIVPLEALEPFRLKGPTQKPAVLDYLKTSGARNFDIELTVEIRPEKSEKGTEISSSNFKFMYWNMAQQLAHHTSGGCSVRVGDLMASGTISGKTPSSYGSMLELAWAGTRPVRLDDGSERVFLKDGDTITMRGWGEKNGVRVGFGEASGKVLPAF